jgi:virginiamycin B lyase
MSPGLRGAGAAKRGVVRACAGLLAALMIPATAAAVDEYPTAGNPGGITEGPAGDGGIWFTQETAGNIARMTTTGAFTLAVNVTPPSGVPPSDPGYVSPLDQITVGPDGALWFTEPRDNMIGRITTAGSVTEYGTANGLAPLSSPEGITLGPDNNLWFTAPGINQIGRITPLGAITMFPGALPGASDITAGPDGALWFTESATTANSIGRITTGGSVTNHYPVPTADSEPSGIVQGPGGGLWFTESAANQIGQIATNGAVTEYPGAGAGPSAIGIGRDGALWFTESTANAIGRMTTGGAITNHFPVPTAGSEPSDITEGPDGALWFTEYLGNKIGRIDTAPPAVIPLPPSVPLLDPTKRRTACKVPRLRGLSVPRAKKKLKRAHCKYRIRGKGRVVSTSPAAGKKTRGTVKVKAKPKRR